MIKGILFVGRKLAGKDTATNYITKALYPNIAFANYNFADAVKKIAMRELGLRHYMCYTQKGKTEYNTIYGMTNRAILEGIGNGLRSTISGDIWVKILENKLQYEPRFWIISDGRFPNEVEMVHKLGGISVLINNKTVIPTEEERASEPVSESSVDLCKCTYVINNGGTLAEYHNAIQELCNKINLTEILANKIQ